MLIGREEYSYFINCTAVQLMIFSMVDRQTLNTNEIALDSRGNKIALENTNKAPNFG